MQRPRGKVRESQSFCVLRTFHHWAFDVYNHREDSPEGVPWWPRFRITGFYCHSLGSIPGWGTEILQSIQLCFFFFFFLRQGRKGNSLELFGCPESLLESYYLGMIDILPSRNNLHPQFSLISLTNFQILAQTPLSEGSSDLIWLPRTRSQASYLPVHGLRKSVLLFHSTVHICS